MVNSWLIWWISVYIIVSVIIWLYAAKKVKTERDYILASKWLPIYITIATVFATWFWSETVLWTSSTFLEGWISSIIADPFWASLCLILAWMFFARPLYRMWILTLWDFYRKKYWRTVEVLASICIIISYLWWVSAQIVALWVIFNVLSSWVIPQATWSWIWAWIVLIYTIFWWMWSVAMTDFLQMIIIVVWMLISAFFVTWEVGWFWTIMSKAIADNKFVFFPEWVSAVSIIWFFAALLTLWFWSIPQEDVFQRMMSAKSEKIAKYWTIIWWVLYLIIAFLPIMLAYAWSFISSEQFAWWVANDSQMALPNLILYHTPLFVQVMFFWALLSAIMSTASWTLLAPSALLAQNILKPYFENFSDKKLVKLTRMSVLFFFILVMSFVSYRYYNSEANIFSMVENAYKITLAWAFIPLAFGLYWKNAHNISWFLSLTLWILVWILVQIKTWDIENPQIWYEAIPPQFWWMFASIIWFIMWQILSKYYKAKDEK